MFTQILVLIQVKKKKKKTNPDFFYLCSEWFLISKILKYKWTLPFWKILQFNERISGMKKIAGSAFRLAAWMYDEFIYIKI